MFGLWALITTLRLGGLKSENTRLRGDNSSLTDALASQVAENADYQKRAQLRIEHLMDELESIEDKQHAEIAKIEDPEKRRRRRRAFVADVLGSVLLSEEATSAGSADEAILPEEGASDPADSDSSL